MSNVPLLSVENLNVEFSTSDGVVHAVNDVSFSVHSGKTLGIVGESGSGKSVTASSILKLNTGITASTSGSILFNGKNILGIDDKAIRAIRGSEIAMIFQDPLSALNPYYTIGSQIIEAYKVHHKGVKKKEARKIALEMLHRVGIPNPEARIDEYPHQFSGGMRQRIVIATALINSPKLLIADEPTTALDVTVQAQILDLMKDIQRENGMAIILITHDLGVVAETCDDVAVMYGGRIVEKASVQELFITPTHPYSFGLLGAVRSLDNSARGELQTIAGSPPSLLNLPSGCSFLLRCNYADATRQQCGSSVPTLQNVVPTNSLSACHLRSEALNVLKINEPS
ncbi:MAG: ABC transporter ATP-binding protein [bacterium]